MSNSTIDRVAAFILAAILGAVVGFGADHYLDGTQREPTATGEPVTVCVRLDTGFAFALNDADGDGWVDQDSLEESIINNNGACR